MKYLPTTEQLRVLVHTLIQWTQEAKTKPSQRAFGVCRTGEYQDDVNGHTP